MGVARKEDQAASAQGPQGPRDDDPWVTLNEAERIRGKARNSVLLEALDGKIRHQKVAGRRVFHRADLELLATTATSDDAD